MATVVPGGPHSDRGRLSLHADLLRVGDGLLAEYWVNSDMHVLLARLQVTPAG